MCKIYPLHRLQDINLSEVPLREQFYNFLFSGNVVLANKLYNDNPTLHGKVVNADMLNRIVESVIDIQKQFYNNSTLKLDELSELFQISIDNLIYIGQYKEGELYTVNNFVLHKDKLYYCIKDTRDNPENSTNWIFIDAKGETGSTSLGVNYEGNWLPNKTYNSKTLVTSDNMLYLSKTQNKGKYPKDNPNDWMPTMEIISRGIYVSKTIPPNLELGDVFIRILGEYTWEDVDTMNRTFEEVEKLNINFNYTDKGEW